MDNPGHYDEYPELTRADEDAERARKAKDNIMSDTTELPKLKSGEEFVCAAGCGTTTAEQYDFEYSREEFPDGRVMSKTMKAWRARCCGADLFIYNNLNDDFTPIDGYKS